MPPLMLRDSLMFTLRVIYAKASSLMHRVLLMSPIKSHDDSHSVGIIAFHIKEFQLESTELIHAGSYPQEGKRIPIFSAEIFMDVLSLVFVRWFLLYFLKSEYAARGLCEMYESYIMAPVNHDC